MVAGLELDSSGADVIELAAEDLERIFGQAFCERFNTRLEGGGEEPIYLPAGVEGDPHRLIYRFDYAASALHEISHWCVAGAQRRLLEDFGYWYAPDGRNYNQQREFERVEVKPQAFEWIFSVAAGRRFRPSADNLSAGLGASEEFKDAVFAQVLRYCKTGLPERAGLFAALLAATSGLSDPLSEHHYQRESL